MTADVPGRFSSTRTAPAVELLLFYNYTDFYFSVEIAILLPNKLDELNKSSQDRTTF